MSWSAEVSASSAGVDEYVLKGYKKWQQTTSEPQENDNRTVRLICEAFALLQSTRHLRVASQQALQIRLLQCNCMIETFEMLRLHPDPSFKAFLNDQRVWRTVVSEALRWITEPWYRGMNWCDERVHW
jgi:hypothetical protein